MEATTLKPPSDVHEQKFQLLPKLAQTMQKNFLAQSTDTTKQAFQVKQSCFLLMSVCRPQTDWHTMRMYCDVDEPLVLHLLFHLLWMTATCYFKVLEAIIP
jgi:hypothetical protein